MQRLLCRDCIVERSADESERGNGNVSIEAPCLAPTGLAFFQCLGYADGGLVQRTMRLQAPFHRLLEGGECGRPLLELLGRDEFSKCALRVIGGHAEFGTASQNRLGDMVRPLLMVNEATAQRLLQARMNLGVVIVDCLSAAMEFLVGADKAAP